MNYSNLISENILLDLCKEISGCFSGSELTRFMNKLNLPHVLPDNATKYKRIYESLLLQQQRDNSPNIIFAFIKETSHPINFKNNKYVSMNEYLSAINIPLAFLGLNITLEGKLTKTTPATTLSEAQKRSNELISILKSRGIHSEVIKYCTPELLANDYFHAVFEAVKGVFSRIRELSHCTDDGGTLIHTVFNSQSPILIITACTNSSQINEQNGFKQILLGITNMFRNPLAHESRLYWKVSKQDAIDLLTMLSFVHRKLDNCIKIR